MPGSPASFWGGIFTYLTWHTLLDDILYHFHIYAILLHFEEEEDKKELSK